MIKMASRQNVQISHSSVRGLIKTHTKHQMKNKNFSVHKWF